MGKRQTRICKADISKHLTTLSGKEANVLLANQTTLHGYIDKLENNTLLLRDLRGRTHLLRFNDIEEIMLDRQTAY